MSRTGDDGGVKAKQQAAKGTNNRASPQVSVQDRIPFVDRRLFIASFRRLRGLVRSEFRKVSLVRQQPHPEQRGRRPASP